MTVKITMSTIEEEGREREEGREKERGREGEREGGRERMSHMYR